MLFFTPERPNEFAKFAKLVIKNWQKDVDKNGAITEFIQVKSTGSDAWLEEFQETNE